MTEFAKSELLTTNRKALSVNLDDSKYGTFAEIGAGQETARNFFQAGDTARTIAKTISAYDMAFSDHIDYRDFLHRIDSLGTSGNYNLISN